MLWTTDEQGNKKTENILNLEGNVINSGRFDNNSLQFYTYNKDSRNSTSTLVDENLNGATAYKYDEFGNMETLGNTALDNEVCYTGGVNDAETGQLYLNARYYNPQDGRFVTLDTYRG